MKQVAVNHKTESKMKQGTLILCPPDTKLLEILFIAVEFLDRNPEILTMIEKDQDAHGLAKKKIRQRNKQYHEEMNERLPGLDVSLRSFENGDKVIELCQGRPRMTPFQIFIFMMLRGYFGSIKAAEAHERLVDSMTLYNFFLEHNLSMPSPNSILDNLNCLSSDTYVVIHKAQLAMVMAMDLDDFCRVYIDSTTVEANSAWPTDSRILLKWVQPVFFEMS